MRLHFIFTAWLPRSDLRHQRWGVCKYSKLYFMGESDIPDLPFERICSQLVFPGRTPLVSPGSHLSDTGQAASDNNKIFFCAKASDPFTIPWIKPATSVSWHQPQTNAANWRQTLSKSCRNKSFSAQGSAPRVGSSLVHRLESVHRVQPAAPHPPPHTHWVLLELD